jgi:hypothetical protein
VDWINGLEVCRQDWSGSRHGPAAGFCEHSNEPSGSTKTELIDYMSDYQFLKDSSARCQCS